MYQVVRRDGQIKKVHDARERGWGARLVWGRGYSSASRVQSYRGLHLPLHTPVARARGYNVPTFLYSEGGA